MIIYHTKWTLYIVVVQIMLTTNRLIDLSIRLEHLLLRSTADTSQEQDTNFTDNSSYHKGSGCLSTCCCCCMYHDASALGRNGGALCCDHLCHPTTSNNTLYLTALVGMIILLLISWACIGIVLFVHICKGDQGLGSPQLGLGLLLGGLIGGCCFQVMTCLISYYHTLESREEDEN